MNCAERLVSIFGSQAEVARRMKLDRAVVSHWVKSGYIPSRWAVEVEHLSGGRIAATEVLNEAYAARPIRVKSRGEDDLPFGHPIAGSDNMNPYVPPKGYRARIRNHGHSCFLCEIVIRSQFHTTYEPEA
jgi:hypothetical protein